jgi:hypothetical protein
LFLEKRKRQIFKDRGNILTWSLTLLLWLCRSYKNHGFRPCLVRVSTRATCHHAASVARRIDQTLAPLFARGLAAAACASSIFAVARQRRDDSSTILMPGKKNGCRLSAFKSPCKPTRMEATCHRRSHRMVRHGKVFIFLLLVS